MWAKDAECAGIDLRRESVKSMRKRTSAIRLFGLVIWSKEAYSAWLEGNLNEHHRKRRLEELVSSLQRSLKEKNDEIVGLKATLSIRDKSIESMAAEIERLREIEAKYKRITDRDERGRFVNHHRRSSRGACHVGAGVKRRAGKPADPVNAECTGRPLQALRKYIMLDNELH